MDDNKLEVLKKVEYALIKCCGECEFGRFEKNQTFGTCSIKTYQHLKHTGEPRQLSIFLFGYCKDFEQGVNYVRDEFFNKITKE